MAWRSYQPKSKAEKVSMEMLRQVSRWLYGKCKSTPVRQTMTLFGGERMQICARCSYTLDLETDMQPNEMCPDTIITVRCSHCRVSRKMALKDIPGAIKMPKPRKRKAAKGC